MTSGTTDSLFGENDDLFDGLLDDILQEKRTRQTQSRPNSDRRPAKSKTQSKTQSKRFVSEQSGTVEPLRAARNRRAADRAAAGNRTQSDRSKSSEITRSAPGSQTPDLSSKPPAPAAYQPELITRSPTPPPPAPNELAPMLPAPRLPEPVALPVVETTPPQPEPAPIEIAPPAAEATPAPIEATPTLSEPQQPEPIQRVEPIEQADAVVPQSKTHVQPQAVCPEPPIAPPSVAPPASEHGRNRRYSSRYAITRGVSCYPLLNSLEVDRDGRVDGIIVDISETGVGLNLHAQNVHPGDIWVMAVESDKIGWRFIDFRILDTTSCGENSTHVNAIFDGPLHGMFVDDMVLPVFDPQEYRYKFPFTDSVLTSLCAIGAAQRIPVDQLLVCPDCLALPTVRSGCSICLSNETGKSQMIHHFACANVDFVDAFDRGDEVVCPKCLGRKMIIGADYEYLDGPTQCFECGHNDLEEIMIGHCMQCSHRFPFERATTIEVVGYRVNRLDPLALLDTV